MCRQLGPGADDETLRGYGHECTRGDDSFTCMGPGDDGGWFTSGGSNEGSAWAWGGADEYGPPAHIDLELQSLAWALTGRDEALYDVIFGLEVGETALVDGLWMSHFTYLAGDSEVQAFTVEVGCWAVARTDS